MAFTICGDIFRQSVSRRVLLRSGTAIAALGLVPRWTFGIDPLPCPELYAFRAPDSPKTVIGLSIPTDRAPFAITNVRIHVGTKTWSTDVRNLARTQFSDDNHVRIFAGTGMQEMRFVDVVVLELDACGLPATPTFDVWAEISGGEKQRRRIGNPIVAALVRCDRELERVYQRISPADDRAVLAPVITRIITERAKRLGIASDPDAYAHRLVDVILPDVIKLKPASPLGFTYASQNGRHPAENTAEIVRTLLGASLLPVIHERVTMPLDRFPYLISPTELA